jgi:poly-gamma-glutamate capsule biosynthesis protein CapA/YwtB (metallophosphatase superfamily)
VKRLPFAVAVGALLLAVAGSALGWGAASPGSTPAPSAVAAGNPTAAPSSVAGSPSAAVSEPPASSTPVPTGSPTPSVPVATTVADVSIVPVAQFRTTVTGIGRDDVREALAGTSPTWQGLEVVDGEATSVLAGLGVDLPAGAPKLIRAANAAALTSDLAKYRKRLGILRADAVTPGVRALAWGGRSLFGVDAVGTIGDWGLTARLPQPKGTPAFDPKASWTLVAGGDIMLDRGVAQTLKIKGKGADYPFAGGSADITSRYCCSSFGWELPKTARTGNAGAMRHLLSKADLAIANFENPAPDNFRYHTSGTVFSADPKLIAGLADAGIDWVGIANNHIRDAGGVGILQTISNLKDHGIAASGAGKNLAAARKPAILTAGGVKVAMLAYDTIAKSYAATANRAGSAQMSATALKADVAAARKAGAQVVIVFPHWGTEYDPTPFAGQQNLAHIAIDAGADMVIGNHAHWAGAMEVYDGKPIWYALGNFVFDQAWSEPTMEGITLELTFHGPTLVQARMRPHVILDKSQPNFLDPAGDGRVVLGQIYDASKTMLPW